MSIFYGVTLSDKELSLAFDLLRFVLQPDAYRRTHITVRGPYKRRLSASFLKKFDVTSIGIDRPGHFFHSNQSTVFLVCEVPGIRDVWHKPDFKDGIPHLTLYDGNDRDFAIEVIRIIQRYRWNIWVKSSELKELRKKSNSEISMNIFEHEFSLYFRERLSSKLSFGPHKFSSLSKKKRLEIFDALIKKNLAGAMIPRIEEKAEFLLKA